MKHSFPKRTTTHIAESKSFSLLNIIAPDTWVLREVTERDYGIDCYIEICDDDNQLTGNLAHVQLKSSVNGIKWKSNSNGSLAKSHSIKTSTANYWMGLPAPVFLVEADLQENTLYFVSVEPEMRKQYQKLSTQASISFDLNRMHSLSCSVGMKEFTKQFNEQKKHADLAFHLTSFLCQLGTLHDFVRFRQNYDAHMEVEPDDFLQFKLIHEICRKASRYLRIPWNVPTLESLIKQDQIVSNDTYVLLHEHTLDLALREIEKLIPNLALNAIELVAKIESDYWRARDYPLYALCSSGELQHLVDYFESRVSI